MIVGGSVAINDERNFKDLRVQVNYCLLFVLVIKGSITINISEETIKSVADPGFSTGQPRRGDANLLAREGNVFTGVCHSVHNQPHGYWFTAHPCYGAVGSILLQCFLVWHIVWRKLHGFEEKWTEGAHVFRHCKSQF